MQTHAQPDTVFLSCLFIYLLLSNWIINIQQFLTAHNRDLYYAEWHIPRTLYEINKKIYYDGGTKPYIYDI